MTLTAAPVVAAPLFLTYSNGGNAPDLRSTDITSLPDAEAAPSGYGVQKMHESEPLSGLGAAEKRVPDAGVVPVARLAVRIPYEALRATGRPRHQRF
jgi:hypothetical protein